MATFVRTEEHYAAGSLTLPQEYYISDEMFARERERIFKKYWICTGHQSRIPNAGDYFLLDLFGESLIIDTDLSERVHQLFHNFPAPSHLNRILAVFFHSLLDFEALER